MPVTLRHDRGNVYHVEISGRLRKQDFDMVQRELAGVLQHPGNVRLLVRLAGFQGWEADAGWRDLGFYVRYGDRIERIAIVGDEQWRSEALMFAAADLRKGEVAFFPALDMDGAATWLAL